MSHCDVGVGAMLVSVVYLSTAFRRPATSTPYRILQLDVVLALPVLNTNTTWITSQMQQAPIAAGQ